MDALHRVAIWGPLGFILILEGLRRWLFLPRWGPTWATAAHLLLAAGAIVIFARWIFGINRAVRQREQAALSSARQRYTQLVAIREAGLAITADLDLESVLQKVVDLSRQVVMARYGALGVLAESGRTFDRFIVSGLDAATRQKIGPLPTGRGVLGAVIATGKPLRLADLGKHPTSIGFPPHHPPMHSFLGVPVVYQERILGHLYLTEKDEGQFTEQDQAIVEQFALHAAVAITNASLYSQVEDLAVIEERERIGMDLHDGTIQSLYALGLELEDIAERPNGASPAVEAELNRAIDTVGRIIGDIRHYIFDLKLPLTLSEPLRKQVAQLLAALQPARHLDVRWDWADDVEPYFQDRTLRTALLHFFREALSNVIKHASAGQVVLAARLEQDELLLSVEDDGCGFDPVADRARGRGLGNMQARAAGLTGRLTVTTEPGQGTTIVFHLPLTMLKEVRER